MAENNTTSNQFSNILKTVGGKFKKDFFKYSLITIWIITIVFFLIINLFVIFNVEGTYEGQADAFAGFDFTKVILESIISIAIIFSIIFVFAKRNLSHRIGIITSSIIIFESIFVNVFYSIYSAFSETSAQFDPNAGWNIFKHWLIGIIHVIAIIMILIDMKKNKNSVKPKEENKQDNKEEKEEVITKTETKKIKETEPIQEETETKDEKEKEEEKHEEEEEPNNSGYNDEDKKDVNSTNGSSLSSEDLEALNELSNMDVTDSDKEQDEEELKKIEKDEDKKQDKKQEEE
jgi:hypothetical protein